MSLTNELSQKQSSQQRGRGSSIDDLTRTQKTQLSRLQSSDPQDLGNLTNQSSPAKKKDAILDEEEESCHGHHHDEDETVVVTKEFAAEMAIIKEKICSYSQKGTLSARDSDDFI